jgi:hypothetical protein
MLKMVDHFSREQFEQLQVQLYRPECSEETE